MKYAGQDGAIDRLKKLPRSSGSRLPQQLGAVTFKCQTYSASAPLLDFCLGSATFT